MSESAASKLNMIAATITGLIAMAVTTLGAVFYDLWFNFPIKVCQVVIVSSFGFLGGFLAYAALHVAHLGSAKRAIRRY